MVKNIEWWRSTAIHMWRTYFAVKRQQEQASSNVVSEIFVMKNMTDADKKIFAICHKVFTEQFVSSDQDILQMYFTSRWGDDQYAVEDYSLRKNVPTRVIWSVIRRANRRVIEDLGILERREDVSNE